MILELISCLWALHSSVVKEHVVTYVMIVGDDEEGKSPDEGRRGKCKFGETRQWAEVAENAATAFRLHICRASSLLLPSAVTRLKLFSSPKLIF